MPKYLADVHNQFMKDYFETTKKDSIVGKERFVLPINK